MKTYPNAKINLGLDILRKRPDGYHDIATVMIGLDWCDDIEIRENEEGRDRLMVEGMGMDCGEGDNLVMRAVRAMRKQCAFPGVDITMEKKIPYGAGLGGGSADAAFTVKALNEFFELGLNEREMEEMVGRLGADCPFFIADKPALCTGTGTQMRHVVVEQLKGVVALVVKPGVTVPTREAYAGTRPAEPRVPLVERLQAPIEQWQRTIVNAFEPSVFGAHPCLAGIKQRLIDKGAVYASMSGSGSALYGLFRGATDIGDVEKEFPDCQSKICRLML